LRQTILLTGGSGFLGSNLLRRLVADGHDLILLKRSKSDLSRISSVLSSITAYNADTQNLTSIFEKHKIDTIVHCATNYGRGNQPPTEIIEANLTLPLQLVQLAAKHGVRSFINSDTILDKQVSYYSLSKRQFLDWLSYFASNLVCVNVALEHFYGPFDDPSKFVTRIIQDLLRGVPQIDLTPGKQKRDFIYIDDVVHAYSKIITFTHAVDPGLHKFEVGSHLKMEIREFVELVAKLTGNKKTILNFGALPYRKNEVMESSVDTSALEALGWNPRITIEEGIEKTIYEERKSIETP